MGHMQKKRGFLGGLLRRRASARGDGPSSVTTGAFLFIVLQDLVWAGTRVQVNLDAEYDNRGRVKDHPAIIDGWGQDSEAFRRQARGELDVPYGSGARERFDVFLPSGPLRGAAMFIHGGYWQSLQKETFSHLANGLVTHGVAVVIPGYDLCPHVRIGDIVEQIASACAIAAWKLHTPILVTGHSAGGHLAAEMMTRDWSALEAELGFDPFPAAMPISGLFDLLPLVETRVNIALRMDEAEAERFSPLRRKPAKRKNILAVVGCDESSEYHRQTHALCDEWGRAGAVIASEVVPGANHFTVIAPLGDPDSRLVGQALDLLRR